MYGPLNRRQLLMLAAGSVVGGISTEGVAAKEKTQKCWPMERYDATGTGYRAFGGGPRSDPVIRWRQEYDEPTPPVATTVFDGRVYHVRRDQITVHETQTGTEKFSFTDGPYLSTISSSIPSKNRPDIAVVANENGVTGLDPSGGFSVFGIFRLPARQWKYPRDLTLFENSRGPLQFATSPVIAGDRLYFSETRSDSSLVALDRSTGHKKWVVEFETNPTRPAVSNGRAFVSVWDRGVVAVDTQRGAVQWRQNTAESQVFGPAVADNVVYVTDEWNVYALQAENGSVIWRHELDSRIPTSPVVTSDLVLVATEERLHSFDRQSGTRRWQRDGGSQAGNLSVAVDTIYQPMGDKLRAVDSTGKILWTLAVDAETATPAIGDGTVYLSTARSLYAIESGTSS